MVRMGDIRTADYVGARLEGAIGNNSLEHRQRMRRHAANWARRQHPQEWGASAEVLTELIDMLGLAERYDVLASTSDTPRPSVRDCGPVPAARATRT